MSTAPLDLTSQVQKKSVLPDVIAQALASPSQGQGDRVGDLLKASIGAEDVKPEFNPGTPNPEPEVPTEDNPLGGFDAIQKLIASPKGGGLESSTPQPSLAPQPPAPKPQTSFGQKLAKVLPILGMAGGALEAAGNGPFHPPVGAEMYQNALAQAGQRALKRQELEQVEVPKAQAYADYMSGRNETTQNVADTKAKASTQNTNTRAGATMYSADTAAKAKTDTATINANSRNQIAALQAGAPMHISEEDAALAGQPQLANQDINGKTLQNFIKILGSKGIKIQDMGGEGLWTIDRAGNRLRQVSVSSPSQYRAQAIMALPSIRAANTPVDVFDPETGQLKAISQRQQLQSGTPSAAHQVSTGKAEATVYQPALEADYRLKKMYNEAADPSGASDMALLFDHIAMTGGDVKGMRMGTFLTNEHMKARSIPEELGVLYNHVVAGQALSPQQRVNFVRLAEEVRASKWGLARRTAGVTGFQNEPAPDPELPSLPEQPSTAPVPANSTSPQQVPRKPIPTNKPGQPSPQNSAQPQPKKKDSLGIL